LSKKNRYDLDTERLASTDEHGNRIYIYPEDVKGKWKNRRYVVYVILVFLYLVLPWIYINEKPFLMLNISKREFTFAGQTLFGLEPILFFLLFASVLFFIAFLISKLGRVWCGWGCPQTVFIQTIFLKIEGFIEGNARARMALDEAPWTMNKIFKRSFKWIIYTIISLHIAHTFVGYFVGPRELFAMTMQAPSENLAVFISMSILTLIFLLDFGWFREQFCIIACPYGRIQSVLMDEHSKVIAYDVKRGEPRRGTSGINQQNEGDCVNCYSCVKVCPTGIDIRRGVQLECIACTQCIDACDDIMQKLDKPKGLIRYSSEVEMNTGKKGQNFRPYLYVTISLILISSFAYFLRASTVPELVFLRGVGAPYLVSHLHSEKNEKTKVITNKFTLKIKHQGSDHYPISISVADSLLKSAIHLQVSESPIMLDRAEKKVFIFFKFDQSLLVMGVKPVQLNVHDVRDNTLIITKEVSLVGPLD